MSLWAIFLSFPVGLSRWLGVRDGFITAHAFSVSRNGDWLGRIGADLLLCIKAPNGPR